MGLLSQTIIDAMRAKQTNTAQDADAIYAQLTREQFDDFYKDFGAFEDSLIDRAKNDTSLIDKAKADAPKTAQMTREIAERNASRYGIGLTPDQIKSQESSIAHTSALGASDAINNARLAQKDANNSLIDSLIDIGSGVNSAALGQLGSAAQDATARRNAYTQAQASYKSNLYSTAGSLGAAAILAFAL